MGSQEVAAVNSVNLFSLCSKDLPKDPVVSNHRVPGHEALSLQAPRGSISLWTSMTVPHPKAPGQSAIGGVKKAGRVCLRNRNQVKGPPQQGDEQDAPDTVSPLGGLARVISGWTRPPTSVLRSPGSALRSWGAPGDLPPTCLQSCAHSRPPWKSTWQLGGQRGKVLLAYLLGPPCSLQATSAFSAPPGM